MIAVKGKKLKIKVIFVKFKEIFYFHLQDFSLLFLVGKDVETVVLWINGLDFIKFNFG